MNDLAHAVAVEPETAELPAEKAKILLVDDEPKSLFALQELLSTLNQNLMVAQSGEEALRLALKNDFAVILLDVRMPGIDGFETARLIRSRERSKSTPIIFLTAAADEMTSMFRGYEVGAVDYLMKPFDPLILRAKVAVFIELWEKTVEIRRRDALLAEQELQALERESEVRYRSLADAVPQIVWTTDADGRTLFYNERWYEYTGLKPGAKADPVKDDTRSGYWWWPTEPASNADDKELWGNRGVVYSQLAAKPEPPAPPAPAAPASCTPGLQLSTPTRSLHPDATAGSVVKIAERSETPAIGPMSRRGLGEAKIRRERRLVSACASSAVLPVMYLTDPSPRPRWPEAGTGPPRSRSP